MQNECHSLLAFKIDDVGESVDGFVELELSDKVDDDDNDDVGLQLGAADIVTFGNGDSDGKSVGDREREDVVETIELLVGFIEGASVSSLDDGTMGDDIGDPVSEVVGNELSETVGDDDNNVGDSI